MQSNKVQTIRQDATKQLAAASKKPPDAHMHMAGQFLHLIRLLLRFKAYRFVTLLVAALIMHSHLIMPLINRKLDEDKSKQQDASPGLTTYTMSEFVRGGHRVLIDRMTFPEEVELLTSIAPTNGGSTSWLKDCSPETCRVQFFGQRDASVVAHFRYSKDRNDNKSTLECYWADDPTYRCSILYQLMTQSIFTETSPHDGIKDVQIFTFNDMGENSPDKDSSHGEDQKSLDFCSAWMDKGSYRSHFIRPFFLMKLGMSFYFLISTVAFIHSIKMGGFYQQLVRNGFSVTCYWAVIWIVTVSECLIFSALFVLSHYIVCPGQFASENMARVFFMLSLMFIQLATTALLLQILLPSIMTLSLVMMVVCLLENFMQPTETTRTSIGNIFPQAHVTDYIATYVSSGASSMDGKSRSKEVEDHGPYNTMLLQNIAFATLLIMATTFIDFFMATGNGMRLPLYFPFMWKFWLPDIGAKSSRKVANIEVESGPHIEPVIAGLTPSITVDRVSKSYRCLPYLSCTQGPQVLQNLSCKIYKNQITALIGHNGAGKSTLIKMLTGEENPESGVAYIEGINATDPIERLALRGSISVCPQFDALCETLSVIECIQVTLISKRIGGHSELERARSMLTRLGLGDKENVMSTDLSGGQKRKVSTVLSLLGDPQVVFLDEPTSGLDPVSRRQLWQLLQEQKLGRSIVLCTQFMDEADILADRKIFLSGGNIVCAGSSMFLKRAFGCSFRISASLKSETDAQKLLSRLEQVQAKSQLKTEIQLEIPYSKPSVLISTVQMLEGSNDVEAFGLSQANLDEAFMKLSGISSTDVIDAFRSGDLSKLQQRQDSDATGQVIEELRQLLNRSVNTKPSIIGQFRAMLCVNLKKQWRTSSTFWGRYVVCAALLLILIFAIWKSKAEKDRNSLASLSQYTGGYSTSAYLHDEGSSMAAFNQSDLLFGGYDITKLDSIVISKPKDKTLKSFLQENSTRHELREKCRVVEGSCSKGPIGAPVHCEICMVMYASTWDTNETNLHRKIAVGVYFYNAWVVKDDTFRAFIQGFNKIWKHFGRAHLENGMALSLLEPLSQFTYQDRILLVVAFIFCLFPVSFLSDPIDDMTSGVRSQLLSMGMAYSSYWINLFVLHWVQYSLCLSISVGILFTWDKYRHWQYAVYVIVPVIIFGTTSNQMLMYLVANVTRTKNTLVIVVCNIAAISCTVALITFTSSTTTTLTLIVLLPPIAPMALIFYGLLPAEYTRKYYMADSLSSTPHAFDNFWNHRYVMLPTVMIPVHVVLLCGILMLTEYRSELCARNSSKQRPVHKGSDKVDQCSSVDHGAQKEQNRLMQVAQNPDNVLEVRQLSKTYPNGVHAVRGVTFGVMSGEIFGLLGANGAGKSTSLSVIVGEDTSAGGSVQVRTRDGRWVSGRSAAAMGVTGFCPQHNPLFDFITVAEHLALYATIRGLASSDAQSQADALMRGLRLQEHRDKLSSQLSGGNKRRLCLAIALLGDPNLIVIDEASTGVDPENKRFIWAAIRGMMNNQRAVMVTTHSMEEVEALCNRVAIMNHGRIIAFGTVQQIRSLHGDAYTLDVLLAQDKSLQQKKSSIKTAVTSHFKGVALLEDLGLCMQFVVPKKSVASLSAALKWLNANQNELGILSCSLCQMSLDQVFVKLVKKFDSSLSDPA